MKFDQLQILVLDDDEVDYRILSRHLEAVQHPKYQLLRASTIAEARALISEHKFDAALIDYRLSGKETGLEFVEELGGRKAPFPVVLLTGLSDNELDHRALDYGVYDYINKLSLTREVADRSIRFALTSFLHERQLREAKLKAQEQANINRQILSVVGHEMKSPVSSLIGYSDYIIGNCASGETRSAAVRMRAASIYLEDFLQNLTEYVRLDGGHANVRINEFELHLLLQETTDFFLPYAEHKNITLRSDFDIKPGNLVSGDRLRIRQIMINLIKNAINYSDSGTVTVTAQLDKQILIISVRDQGAGMPQEKVDAILSDAYLQQKASADLKGGLGIGLSICRRLIDLMSGEFQLESREGAGTVSSFSIPLTVSDNEIAA